MCVLRRRSCSAEETAWRKELVDEGVVDKNNRRLSRSVLPGFDKDFVSELVEGCGDSQPQ